MKKKYAYANIKIPVELKANGTIEPMKEYVQIEFSICNELPEKNVNNLNVMNNLHSLFHNIPNFENRPTNKIPISKSINDEIEQPLFNIRSHEEKDKEKDEEKIIKSKNIQPYQSLYQERDSQEHQISQQISEQTSEQISQQTSEQISEFIPIEVPISLIKQYKKREGASGGTVGSPESFKNKKRNKFNITAKMRE
jgi:hypothetical protein